MHGNPKFSGEDHEEAPKQTFNFLFCFVFREMGPLPKKWPKSDEFFRGLP